MSATGYLAIGVVAFLVGFGSGALNYRLAHHRWPWGRRRTRWVEATEHDVSVTPGGHFLHHSTCWCKKRPDRGETQ